MKNLLCAFAVALSLTTGCAPDLSGQSDDDSGLKVRDGGTGGGGGAGGAGGGGQAGGAQAGGGQSGGGQAGGGTSDAGTSSITVEVKGFGIAPVDKTQGPVTSFTSPQYTFAANTVVFAFFGQKRDPTIPNVQPGIATPGLTWTWVQKACMNWDNVALYPRPMEPCSVGNGRRLDIFMAVVGTSAITAATTLTSSDALPVTLWWSLTEWSGVLTSNPLRQSISMNHRTWSPNVTTNFLDAYWDNPGHSLRTNQPVQPGNLGIVFNLPSELNTLYPLPGVANVLNDNDGTSYLHQRVSTIGPGYSASTIGHFRGADPEPAMCSTGGPGCAHGVMIAIEINHR